MDIWRKGGGIYGNGSRLRGGIYGNGVGGAGLAKAEPLGQLRLLAALSGASSAPGTFGRCTMAPRDSEGPWSPGGTHRSHAPQPATRGPSAALPASSAGAPV